MQKRIVELGSMFRDIYMWRALGFGFLVWTLQTGVLLVFFSRLPPVVPLFYSLVRGQQQLANKYWLWLLPLLSLAILLVHGMIAKYSYGADKLLARMVVTASILVSLLLLIAIGHILIIVL